MCLTSDVHLAEVASVHQILSLIGQKAKVPPDAKNRMYRLVRGREASTEKAPVAEPRPSRPAPDPEPAVTPSPWSGDHVARFRPFHERHARLGRWSWS